MDQLLVTLPPGHSSVNDEIDPSVLAFPERTYDRAMYAPPGQELAGPARVDTVQVPVCRCVSDGSHHRYLRRNVYVLASPGGMPKRQSGESSHRGFRSCPAGTLRLGNAHRFTVLLPSQ